MTNLTQVQEFQIADQFVNTLYNDLNWDSHYVPQIIEDEKYFAYEEALKVSVDLYNELNRQDIDPFDY